MAPRVWISHRRPEVSLKSPLAPATQRQRGSIFNAIAASNTVRARFDLAQMLRGTSYAHAGTSIIDGRKQNVDRALQLLAVQLRSEGNCLGATDEMIALQRRRE
jgi:hypothetical protein